MPLSRALAAAGAGGQNIGPRRLGPRFQRLGQRLRPQPERHRSGCKGYVKGHGGNPVQAGVSDPGAHGTADDGHADQTRPPRSTGPLSASPRLGGAGLSFEGSSVGMADYCAHIGMAFGSLPNSGVR